MAVDDHPIFLDGIANLFDGDPEFELIGFAGNGADALERFRAWRPDITLMDVQMPGLDGIETVKLIRNEFPDARIVMLTMHGEDAWIMRAVRAGACAWVIKKTLCHHLTEVLRKVSDGQHVFESTTPSPGCGKALSEELTLREIDVLKLVCDGHSNRDIGSRLLISENTVKKYMQNLRSKLGANDRAHAVCIAIARGILPTPHPQHGYADPPRPPLY